MPDLLVCHFQSFTSLIRQGMSLRPPQGYLVTIRRFNAFATDEAIFFHHKEKQTIPTQIFSE